MGYIIMMSTCTCWCALQAAFKAMHANFEFMSKLGVDRWCFHDR
jgi:xylose isomerase